MTRRMINHAVAKHWPSARGMTVVGVGYCTPYLGLFRTDAARSIAFMPARQGVISWPTARPCKSALVDEANLPLADAAVDRTLVVHALETAPDIEAFLSEIWRTLAAGGRVLVVAPNRRSMWAQRDSTPFGQGRPFSRSQLTELLSRNAFTPVAWSEALWAPPLRSSLILRSAGAWERFGRSLSLPFAGVHLVEATKQVYRPAQVKRAPALSIFQPVLAPSNAAPARSAARQFGLEHE